MDVTCSLPVIMPNVPNQRWSCHSCGNCCRTLVGHLFEEERERIDRQGWADKLGVAPYVRVGRGHVLNKRDDGACVFLDEQNRCRIHAAYGEDAKPLACRIFPFSVRPVEGGWQASLRFDCPSVVSSKGRPISQYQAWLGKLVRTLDHTPPRNDAVNLQPGVRATVSEIEMVVTKVCRWLKCDKLSLAQRLIGAARITTTLEVARLKGIRGSRLAEFLDLLFAALPDESAAPPAAAGARPRGMLRQLAFAHAEHLSLAEMCSRSLKFRKRWHQLRSARRFRTGRGVVPPLPGLTGKVTFDAVESVDSAVDDKPDVEDLVSRYLSARLEGGSVFGAGYYGWPVFRGLAALWLSVSAAGWLARYIAASDGRARLSLADAGHALGMVDRAATRLPALGTFAERARVSYLLTDNRIARLLHDFSLFGPAG